MMRTISPYLWPCLLLLAAAGVGGVGGCVTDFDRNRESMRILHEQGQYAVAAQMLDDPKNKELYSDRNRLLYWLDRGALALALDDAPTTIELLEKAEAFMEIHREPSTSEEFGRWLLNDTVTPYYGEPYEDVYVNVLKLLAQLERGTIDGGATVEARRLAGKADWLRDRYVRTREEVVKRSDAETKRSMDAGGGSVGGTVDVNEEGEFIESTLGTYLTAITFMKEGDASMQEVAGRRLESSIALQRSLQVGVDGKKFENVGSLRPSDVNVLLVGLSGRAPYKTARRIGPIPLYQYPLYFELPELVGGSAEVGKVKWTATPVGGMGGGEPIGGELDFVEDFRAVATENHKRQLPLIYARTLLRSSAKAAAWYAATNAAKHSTSRGSSRDAVQIGMILGGLAFMAVTEKADLRCWTFLPGRADVVAVKLPPGRYELRMDFLSHGGGVVYAAPVREIEVEVGGSARDLTTVVSHYWR